MLLLFWNGAGSGSGTQTLTPSLFTNSQTFFTPSLSVGTVTLTPSLFTNTQTFYSATVGAGVVTLQPNLVTNTQTFFSPSVTPGAVTLTPSLFTNSQTFYSPMIGSGEFLQPSLFTNDQAFYGPTITVGAVTLSPDLFANDNRFFSPTITGGVVVATKPSGAPGHRIKFRGRFYDSVRDRHRLARDVNEFLSEKQEEQPKPKQPKRKPIRTAGVKIETPPVVLDTREIDELSVVLAQLKARDDQITAYVTQLRAINEALMRDEEEFLLMVA